MYNALFMGWDAPRTGRERQAGELFGSVVNYLATEQKKGTIDSFEPVLMAAHSGDLNGYFMIKGDHKRLDDLRASDDFLKIMMQAGFCLDGFGVVAAYHSDQVTELMGRWQQMVGTNT